MIQRGLSVVVAGHLIAVDRDEDTRVATVHVEPVDEQKISAEDADNIKQAADLLRQRAKRFLGCGWRVVGWELPASVLPRELPPDKRIGDYEAGSGV